METKFDRSTFIRLLMILSVALICVAQDYDFFYLVQQWPGSYSGTQHSRCYPTTEKPAQSFIISGFWPSYNNGSIPTYCDPNNHFNETELSNLISFLQTDWSSLACPSSNSTQLWGEEWEKHGTCSQSVLDQYGYFLQALVVKDSYVDILQMLQVDGIQADGRAYNLNSLVYNLKSAFDGHNVGIECNEDESGNSQFYQVYLCIEQSGNFLIDCPVLPDSKCSDSVVFPSF